MLNEIFEKALSEMSSQGEPYLSPQSFKDFQIEHFGAHVYTRTAEAISIQELSRLAAPLRQRHVMVFRLGGASTSMFALAQAPDRIEDFFIVDAELDSPSREVFLPAVPYSDLFQFSIVGSLTEANAVNLALASGILGHALSLDEPSPRSSPATGQTTYNFDVVPVPNGPTWKHDRGQVEIDAMFVAHRNGTPSVFVVEAKSGQRGTLAKYKLTYACAALAGAGNLPTGMEIVPIYVRSWEEHGLVVYRIAECNSYRSKQDVGRRAVTDLQVTNVCEFSMPLSISRS